MAPFITIIIITGILLVPSQKGLRLHHLISSISLHDIPFLSSPTKGTFVMELVPIYFGCSQLYNLCGLPLHALRGWHSLDDIKTDLVIP